jgi:hypothetical protein
MDVPNDIFMKWIRAVCERLREMETIYEVEVAQVASSGFSRQGWFWWLDGYREDLGMTWSSIFFFIENKHPDAWARAFASARQNRADHVRMHSSEQ